MSVTDDIREAMAKPETEPEPEKEIEQPEPPPKELDEPEPDDEEELVNNVSQQEQERLYEKARRDWEATGKYLIRDMPLFKYEIVIYLGMILVAFMLYAIERVGIVEGALGKAVIPLAIIPIGIWFVKKMLYMPNKNRVPHIHVFNTRVIRFGTVDPKKGYVAFKRGENIVKKYITKVNRHIEQSTGLPCVVTSDLHGENLDLLREKKPDMRSEEFNALLETCKAVTTKNVMNRMMRFTQPSMANPVFILIIINMFMVAVLLIKSFGFFGR